MAVDRAGHGGGCFRGRVPPAGHSQFGEPGCVVSVAAGPGGQVLRGWEQVAFVVVAAAVGQDEVLHGIDPAAHAGDEVVGLWLGAQISMAVEAPLVLEYGDPVSERFGRSQPVRSEEVTVKIQFSLGYPADLSNHPCPVQLQQRVDERAKPDELVAGAGKQPNRRTPRPPAPGNEASLDRYPDQGLHCSRRHLVIMSPRMSHMRHP